MLLLLLLWLLRALSRNCRSPSQLRTDCPCMTDCSRLVTSRRREGSMSPVRRLLDPSSRLSRYTSKVSASRHDSTFRRSKDAGKVEPASNGRHTCRGAARARVCHTSNVRLFFAGRQAGRRACVSRDGIHARKHLFIAEDTACGRLAGGVHATSRTWRFPGRGDGDAAWNSARAFVATAMRRLHASRPRRSPAAVHAAIRHIPTTAFHRRLSCTREAGARRHAPDTVCVKCHNGTQRYRGGMT